MGEQVRPWWTTVIAGVAENQDESVACQQALAVLLPEVLQDLAEVRQRIQVKCRVWHHVSLFERDLTQTVNISKGAHMAEVVCSWSKQRQEKITDYCYRAGEVTQRNKIRLARPSMAQPCFYQHTTMGNRSANSAAEVESSSFAMFVAAAEVPAQSPGEFFN